jgi:hypothetical protein
MWRDIFVGAVLMLACAETMAATPFDERFSALRRASQRV